MVVIFLIRQFFPIGFIGSEVIGNYSIAENGFFPPLGGRSGRSYRSTNGNVRYGTE